MRSIPSIKRILRFLVLAMSKIAATKAYKSSRYETPINICITLSLSSLFTYKEGFLKRRLKAIRQNLQLLSKLKTSTTQLEIRSICLPNIIGFMYLQNIYMKIRFITQFRANITANKPKATIIWSDKTYYWSNLLVLCVREIILRFVSAKVMTTSKYCIKAPPNRREYGT